MKTNYKFTHRILSWVLALAMILSLFPLQVLVTRSAAAGTDTGYTQTADDTTLDDWKKLFPENSTVNAGKVWTDKSAWNGKLNTGGALDNIETTAANSFLVALSAMASNKSITGVSLVPTDTMLVLDVSGSMSGNDAESMVAAANESIKSLLAANKHNRVGVVLYSNDATLLLPLGRYTANSSEKFLSYKKETGFGGSTETVSVANGVKIEGSNNAPTATSKKVVGGTYTQKGLILAMEQFTAASNKITVDDTNLGTLNRKPVLVLMTDGAPTYGTTSFTNPGDNKLGDGSNTTKELTIVTQLTAAYAKAKIEEKYGKDSCLFYTLGLGVGDNTYAQLVLNPALETTDNTTIEDVNDFWDLYESADTDKSVTIGTEVSYNPYAGGHGGPGGSGGPSGSKDITVTKIDTELEHYYVDKYFTADGGANSLADAFKSIVDDIQLQSGYFPTLVEENEDLSGYISFVDYIGRYMEVTDVKGIVLNDTLFTGAKMAQNIVTGGLGTTDKPTALGDEFVHSVQKRLGIESVEAARDLIQKAYKAGQLSYTDEDHYSNYISWLADENRNYLGFYEEGVTDISEAAYIIKSYGFMGQTVEGSGVTASDLMYVTVRVMTKIETGEQFVAFAVPASLVPVINYKVTLDKDNNPTNLETSKASPIRLVYEVALQEDINEFNVTQIVDKEYLNEKGSTNTDGSINFYSNRWDRDKSSEFNSLNKNTYSYFEPSKQNEHYYSQENVLIYTEENTNSLYKGDVDSAPTGTMYWAYTYYQKSGNTVSKEIKWYKISSETLAKAERNEDGSWYIPAGSIRYTTADDARNKTTNKTGTLDQYAIPFAQVGNSGVTEGKYLVGAVLGNNGKITLKPQTGIQLEKKMADGLTAPAETFAFILTNTTNSADNTTYPAWRVSADGKGSETTVKFENGAAKVTLKADEKLYIGGMNEGDVIKIAEEETVAYIGTASGLTNSSVTVKKNEMQVVTFVNEERGTGSLTVGKEIKHDLGTGYEIPAGKKFTMKVTLSGVGTANKTFVAIMPDGKKDKITTDANGVFEIQLEHDQQVTIQGLPTGTKATVVEQEVPNGFTATYTGGENGSVTIEKGGLAVVTVQNAYKPAKVYPVNLAISGTKYVKNENGELVSNWNGNEFVVVLERYDQTKKDWVEVERVTLNDAKHDYTFEKISEEAFDAPGEYYYQVREIEGLIAGMDYSSVKHTFTVVVSDADMNGQLEITKVIDTRTNPNVELGKEDGVYVMKTDFTNVQNVTNTVHANIGIQKKLENDSKSQLVTMAGFQFELYTDAECKIVAKAENIAGVESIESAPSDGVGEASIDIKFKAQGEYVFYLKEVKGSIKNMTYSDQVIKVVVKVGVDPEDATKLTQTTTYYLNDREYDLVGGKVVFTNVYTPDKAILPINFVTKKMDGRELTESEEFAFVVNDQNGETVANGKAGKDGKVTFDEKLQFDMVGEYTFTIKEIGEDKNGVTLDKTVYTIKVTVTDVNGQLKATYSVENFAGDQITFVNTYKAEKTSVAIQAKKTLTGNKSLTSGMFHFELIDNDGKMIQTKTNTDDGSIVFDTIYYDKVGTYTYKVREEYGEDGQNGITYDKSVFTVTVTVTDDGKGQLKATVSYKNGEVSATNIEFVNKYKAAPAYITLTGNKTLTGKVDNGLKGGEYKFTVYKSDSSWKLDTEIVTVENGENGTIQFPTQTFTEAGTYYYIIKEVNGGNTHEGVTYDSSEYHVIITVTDDGMGKLQAQRTVYHVKDGNEALVNGIEFLNIYQVTGDAKVELSGEKTLEGREMTKEDQFVFELFEADEAFGLAENAQPVANAAVDTTTGKFTLKLTYGPADIGVKHYILQEKNAGETLNGVSYDNTTYKITVTVKDNGEGGVTATAELDAALNFTNSYSAEETKTTFEGHKVLTGIRPLKENDFLFDLYKATEDFTIDGDAIQSVRNDKDGNFCFEAVKFDAAGVYFFVVKENSQSPIGGVSYDAAMYQITVWVEDNGMGELVVSETAMSRVLGEESADVEKILFTNSYNASSATVNLGGKKQLTGRELVSGEFNFQLYATGSDFAIAKDATPMMAVNKADGSFVFDALTFTEAKTYYFVICEDQSVKADRVTFDDTVYHVTIEVKDDENGKLVASAPVITKAGSDKAEDGVVFTNVYTPKPADITVDIRVDKTVVNKGTEKIGPEDFQFLLKEQNAQSGITVKTDKDGKAVFTLSFTEDDIGKIYRYQLTEVNDARANVTYSTACYEITIAISLDENNRLVAQVTQDSKEVQQVVTAFENVYDFTPKKDQPVDDVPKTRDDLALSLYLTMMGIACGAAIMLIRYDNKKKVQ